MKKLLSVLLWLALVAVPAFSQTVTGSITASATTCTSTSCVMYALPISANVPVGAVAIQITGTFTATLQFESTVDGSTYVAISGLPVGSAVPASSATAAGIWQFPVAGISAIRVRASAYTSGTASVSMQISPATPTAGGTVTAQIQGAQSSGQAAIVVADSSAAVSVAATNTTQIIAASGSTAVYITGFGLSVGTTAATAQTVQIVYGTGTNCVTGQVALTGAMSGATEVSISADNVPTWISFGGALGMIARTPASQAVCVKLTGTQTVSGVVSFTQFFYWPPSFSEWAEENDIPIWRPRRNGAYR